jgi:VWFA-related protein
MAMKAARLFAALFLVAGLFQSGNITAQQKPEQPAQPQPKAGAQQADPQQLPTFRAGVNFVRVDVIITDKKGEPVADLTAADFQVLEDDKLQKIEQFKLVRSDGRQRPGDEPLREIRTAYDQELEAARDDVRLFAIFFDDYHTRDISALSVKAPLTKFIQSLGPKDLVAVMYPLTPLDAVMFTRNQSQMIRAIDGFQGYKYKYEPRNQFEQEYAHYPTEEVERIRNQVVMGALRALATRLGSLREGRKAIIYVGEGLGVLLPASMRLANSQVPIPQTARPDGPFEETVSFFSYSDLMNQMRDVYDAANRNNAAVYTLDPRGLATNEFHIDDTGVSPDADRRILQQTQDGLRALAEETDGRAIVGRNDLARAMQQIIRDSSAYYLLGYNSAAAPADGKFHEIKVKLSDRAKSRGLQVRARKGYIAPTAEDVKRSMAPPTPTVPQPVQNALASIVQPSAVSGRAVRSWIGMSRGDNGKTRVTFVWEPMPVSPGLKREQAGRVSLLVANETGDVVYRGKVTPAGPSTQAASVSFDAPPGKLEVRMSVEAEAGGVLDNEQRNITVPNLSSASSVLSTPRVFRVRTPREAQALAKDAAAVPMVARDFSRTERVIIRFDVYGDASVTAALLNTTGKKMADVPVTAASAGGTHQIDMPLASLAAGEYVIEVTVKGSAGETKELVAFKVGS